MLFSNVNLIFSLHDAENTHGVCSTFPRGYISKIIESDFESYISTSFLLRKL